jgi:5,6-dimethylbenzimidazole synthase
MRLIAVQRRQCSAIIPRCEAVMMKPPTFDDEFRAQLRALFAWRRDVRRFKTDELPAGTLERMVALACLSPSVGLSQPWRFVCVADSQRRQAIIENFSACNAQALSCYQGEAAARYARLRLAGLAEAPCHLAVFADRATSVGRGLGRHTMPETIEYSVVAAICTLWLAARAEGIGLGWISILDPSAVRRALDVPPHWRFIGYLCLGYPDTEAIAPELERLGWEHRRDPREFLLQR